MTEPMESQEDILITRIIDGQARAEDLQQIAALASLDAGVWDRLAAADADRAALCAAVDHATEIATCVEAPLHELDEDQPQRRPHPLLAASGWMGWAAAAVVALAWGLQGQTPASRPGTGDAVVTRASLNADDALSQYIEASKAENRFVRELPKIMVESHIAEDGRGTEVTYVRQFVEKARVNDLYELSTDESGRPGAVRVNSPIGTRSVMY